MSHTDILANNAIRNLVMPIPVDLYHALSAAGVIDQKTELIEGIIIRKMTKSPLHAFIASELYRFFDASLPPDLVLRKEDPITLAESEPEPDIALVKGRRRDFINSHPNHAELVVEVAISSIELDRQKIAVYAAAAIAECWIVLPEQKTIEIYRKPIPGKRKYADKIIMTAGQTIETICGPLKLQDLF